MSKIDRLLDRKECDYCKSETHDEDCIVSIFKRLGQIPPTQARDIKFYIDLAHANNIGIYGPEIELFTKYGKPQGPNRKQRRSKK